MPVKNIKEIKEKTIMFEVSNVSTIELGEKDLEKILKMFKNLDKIE